MKTISILAALFLLPACSSSVVATGEESASPELGATFPHDAVDVDAPAQSAPASHPRYTGGCIDKVTGGQRPNGSACVLPMQGGAGHCDWTIPAPDAVCVPNASCELHDGTPFTGAPCFDDAGVPGVCVLGYDVAGAPAPTCAH